MGLLDFLLGSVVNSGQNNDSNDVKDWDHSVFYTDRFRKNGSANWVDWEDVSTDHVETDGFEDPYFDDEGEW